MSGMLSDACQVFWELPEYALPQPPDVATFIAFLALALAYSMGNAPPHAAPKLAWEVGDGRLLVASDAAQPTLCPRPAVDMTCL